MGYVVTKSCAGWNGPEALEVLTRCLQSDDDRIAMMAAQAILDRGYGRPMQSIDVREDGPTVRYIRRDASQGQDHRGVAQGQCGVPSVDQTGGRSLISWDRYSDSSAVLACLLGPISPHPRHQSWEVPVPRRPLFLVPDPETQKQVPTSLRRSRAALTFDKAAQEFTHLGGTERT